MYSGNRRASAKKAGEPKAERQRGSRRSSEELLSSTPAAVAVHALFNLYWFSIA